MGCSSYYKVSMLISNDMWLQSLYCLKIWKPTIVLFICRIYCHFRNVCNIFSPLLVMYNFPWYPFKNPDKIHTHCVFSFFTRMRHNSGRMCRQTSCQFKPIYIFVFAFRMHTHEKEQEKILYDLAFLLLHF